MTETSSSPTPETSSETTSQATPEAPAETLPSTSTPSTAAPSAPPIAAGPIKVKPSFWMRLTGRNGSRLFVSALAAWIIMVSFGAQSVAWLQASLDAMPGDTSHWWQASLIQFVLIGVPTLLLAWRWRSVRYRAIFRAWALVLGYGLLLLPTRLFPAVESQLVILLQALLTLGYWVVVRRWQKEKLPLPRSGLALALLVGALMAIPWLRWGALGSPLDVVLNVLLATGVGLLAWTILWSTWIPQQRRDPRNPRSDRITSGLVAGITLLLMANALSFNGVQLVLMAVLPAAGWLVVASGAPALATILVVAAPLLLIDSDALVLTAMDPLLGYYFVAAFFSMGLAWFLGLLTMIPQPDPAKSIVPTVAWVGAGISLLFALILYMTVGQVGFYGDRLFVVMRDQADLSAVATTPDLTERRAAVYRTLVDHANRTQANVRSALTTIRLGYQPYYLTNGLEVHGGLLVRAWLMTRGDIAEIMVNPRLRPAEPLSLPGEESVDAPTSPEWNLTNIGADRVWRELGVTGEGIVIGQSDSGVEGEHPEFATRYRGYGQANGDDYHWFDPWTQSASPYDLSGHGTHTLGSVLGEHVGVAPGATWFACANLVRNLGNAALYLDCMQFMLAPFPQQGDPFVDGDPTLAADVLNNSWGCPQDFEGCAADVFEPAMNALTQAGIFVVASAGNEGPLCNSLNTPPGIYEDALSVGAIDEYGDLAEFSSVGPVTIDGSERIKPDILAPGVDVLSAWPGGGYRRVSGTSMAGPHMAGVVALMWSANPNLRGDVAGTRAILEATAQPFVGTLEGNQASSKGRVPYSMRLDDSVNNLLGAAYERSCLAQSDLSVVPNNVAGYGVVDAFAAVQTALDELP